MDAFTRRIVLTLGIIFLGVGYVVSLVVLAHDSWLHDGASTDRMVWFGLGSGLVFALTLLGSDVVAAFLRGLGFPIPQFPPAPQLPIVTPPAAPAPTDPPSSAGGA